MHKNYLFSFMTTENKNFYDQGASNFSSSPPDSKTNINFSHPPFQLKVWILVKTEVVRDSHAACSI